MAGVRLLDELGDVLGLFDSADDAFENAGKMFDDGNGDAFHVEDNGMFYHLYGHQLVKIPCPVCGKKAMAMDMVMTHDCHGIPYRKVCPDCYGRIMEEVGYDGEYYDELDECIDYDY